MAKKLGQQDTYDNLAPDSNSFSYSNDDYHPYLKNMAMKQQQDQATQFNDLKNQAALTTQVADQTSSATDTQPLISKEFAQGAQRGASGGLGSMVMQGGLASTMAGGAAGPYGMAAGLGLMALEGDAQAKQAEEQAKAQEAQMRKQQQLSAINSLIAVSKGLGV